MIDLYLPPKPAIIRPSAEWDLIARTNITPARLRELKTAIAHEKLKHGGKLPEGFIAHFMFGALTPGSLTETLVADGAGSQISSGYTNQTGTPFDGTTSKDSNGVAYATPGASYYGKSFSTGKIISKVQVWPATNTGFSFTGNPSITIYGKNGAPSSVTDGATLHATGTFTDQTTMKEMVIASPASYTHNWIAVGGTTQVYIAQIRFYELV